METTDKTVALLQLLAQFGGGALGVNMVTVRTSEPDPVTFVMQGTRKALGPDVFEIPADCYPLREGDQLFALPIVGGQRWAILGKVNGGVVMGTWTGSGVQPDGMTAVLPATLPFGMTLSAGNKVAIAAKNTAGVISYVVLNRY